jgi:hypothetical protein
VKSTKKLRGIFSKLFSQIFSRKIRTFFIIIILKENINTFFGGQEELLRQQKPTINGTQPAYRELDSPDLN